MNGWKLEQGDLLYSHSTRTDSLLKTIIWNSDTEAGSDTSLKSRSFLRRVNDQVRKRQDQSSKDATKHSDKHSVIWGMFMSSTKQASEFKEKKNSDNLHSIKNTEDLTMKQMFDISEKLISEQSDEICGVNAKNWDDSSWKHLSLVGGEKIISLSDSVLCFGKMSENPQSNTVWEEKLIWFKSSSEYRALDTNDGEPMEFEWNIFPGFTTWQLCNKVQEFLSARRRIIFMLMFNDTSWGSKDNEQECELSAQFMREDFHQEKGHSSDLDQRRNGNQLTNTNHKENGTESQN